MDLLESAGADGESDIADDGESDKEPELEADREADMEEEVVMRELPDEVALRRDTDAATRDP